MGTRLTWVTVIGVLCVAASSASAQRPAPAPPPTPVAPVPPPATAADLAAEGVELYKAGDYSRAVTSLERAHQLEPANFDYEYSLAQALRQASQCDKALLHYQTLREAAPDPRTARDVRDQMALCPGGEIEEPAPPPPPPPPPPPAATRDSTSTWTNVGLAAAAGGSLTASVLLFLDAGASDDAAVAARSFDEHEHFAARADRMRIASYVTAAAGVGLAVYSIRRFALLKGQRTEVAITPRTGGGAVVFSGSW